MMQLNLAWQFNFEDLYSLSGLEKIDAAFLKFIGEEKSLQLKKYRRLGKENSDFIIAFAPKLEAFIVALFQLKREQEDIKWQNAFFECKKQFVQKRAHLWARKQTKLNPDLIKIFLGENFSEMDFISKLHGWRQSEEKYYEEINAALNYAAFMLQEDNESILFQKPNPIHFDHLKPYLRDGFNLTDKGISALESLDEAHYCLLCHERDKDSCAKGLKDKKSGKILKEGCPLKEHISEMHLLRRQNHRIAALAALMINNPLCAATGHRICNQCVTSCIFQKQPGVATPKTESEVFKTVLHLDWGFEIYSLLTKWNPLRACNYLPRVISGHKILIVGQGPAGFTLAHYALQSGHEVLAIDGLKIEPLAIPFEPLKTIQDYFIPLSKRSPKGFGGVAEYGITVRWDKNFLDVIRLLLERHQTYTLKGGTFFGSSITKESAFKAGFDHIAICAGAGAPKALQLDGKFQMPKGVQLASDFLMRLQAGGAHLKETRMRLEIHLPALVIGGGLTAIDAATELQAYYIKQVETYEGPYKLWLKHGQAVRAERKWAREEKRLPNFHKLVQKWGGVKLISRGEMKNSKAYRLNHEELAFALEEGVEFCSALTPIEIQSHDGHLEGLKVQDSKGRQSVLPTRHLIIAIGTEKAAPLESDPFLIYENKKGQTISHLGDRNPAYSGSVVHAMASAKTFSPYLNKLLEKRMKSTLQIDKFVENLETEVIAVNRLIDETYELIVRSPAAAIACQAGQFYRIQSFDHSTCSTKPLALTAFKVDRVKGYLHFVFLKKGFATQNLLNLKKGEKLIVMGPMGAPSEIPKNKNMCLIGNSFGNAILLPIGKEARAQGSKVTYFAAYKEGGDIFKKERLEAAADQIIYCIASGKVALRPQDILFKGSIIEALKAHFSLLKDQDHILTIGSDRMMHAVQNIAFLFPKKSVQLAGINSPMQCMMKGICGACLQRQIDPETGKEKIVFSCAQQDQNLNEVDFEFLHNRLL